MFTELMASGSGGGNTKTVIKTVPISAGTDYILTVSELSEIYAVICKSAQSVPSIFGAIKNGDSYELVNTTYYYINSVSDNQVSIHSYGSTTYTIIIIGV